MVLRRLLVSLAYYPSLLFNRAMCAAGLWRRWDWIDEHVLVGMVPTRGEMEELRRLGIGAVVNLCQEFAGHSAELERLGMQQLHLPTLDFHPPTAEDMRRGVAFIRQAIAGGRMVYVHCKAGRGRSVTLAICYLIVERKLTARDAEAIIRRVRPQIDRRLAERACVREIERETLGAGRS